MRKFTKSTVVTILLTLQIMSMAACKEVYEPALEDTMGTSVSEQVETQEFVETQDSDWVDSNYQKYWYQFDQNVYDQMLSSLTENGLMETNTGDRMTYTDANGVQVFIAGMETIPLNDRNEFNNFSEKTGQLLYVYPDEDTRKAAIDQKLDEHYLGWVNGFPIIGTSLVGEVKKGEEYIPLLDLTVICNTGGLNYQIKEDNITLHTHNLKSFGTDVTFKFSTDELKEAEDDAGNMYYLPYFESSTQKVYVTPEVLRNILGWQVSITNEGTLVLFDDIYKVTEGNSFLKQETPTPEEQPETVDISPAAPPKPPVTETQSTAPQQPTQTGKTIAERNAEFEKLLKEKYGVTPITDPKAGYQGTLPPGTTGAGSGKGPMTAG